MQSIYGLILLLGLLLPSLAQAHFALILPSDDIVEQGEARSLRLDLRFLHPAEGHYMPMASPKRFEVSVRGERKDLRPSLREQALPSKHGAEVQSWSTEYRLERPGDHTFFVEPAPYWEPAEDKYILHYTKVCVGAFGLEEGWDRALGIEVEILPLSRPYALWTGNLFSGQVLRHGKPQPFAKIEIEYLNEAAPGKALSFPATPFITQVIKADANGVFHYALPKAGWWGFAALLEAEWTLMKDDVEKPVELGAVYWVKSTDLP